MEHFPGAFEPMFEDCSNPGPVPLHKLDLIFTTRSRLLNLPIEILNIIVQHLPQYGLGGLALANSDCRQIARARQFCRVKLKFSNRDVALLEHIIQFSGRASRNKSDTRSVVPIGHCVRAVIFRDGDKHSDRLRGSKRNYIGRVVKVCNTEGLLPNLELLDFAVLSGTESLPLWQSMHHSNLRYLKLPDSMVDIMPGRDISSLPPEVDRQFRCLKLQRLELRDHRHSYTSYSASLETLSHFASSLESLTWTSLHQAMPAATYKSWTGVAMAPLVNLRRASLYCAKLDSSLLQAVLVSSKLTILELPFNKEVPFEILNQHGTIATLRHFTTSTTEELLPFISCNAQITQLRLQLPLTDEFISGSLLPLLIDSFHNLKCLALNWKETTISNQGLYLLSFLRQLRRLFLSAGFSRSWRSEFLIDHPLTLSHLSRLPKLRELFFYHDTYENGHGWSDPSDYYQHCRMNETGDLDYAFQPAHERFEIIHKRKMTEVARDYARDIASLEWLFVGQYAFIFETRIEEGGARSPKVLSEKRIELVQDSRTGRVIRVMFGSYDPTFGSKHALW